MRGGAAPTGGAWRFGVLAALLVVPLAAGANDSTAVLGAGGLELVESADIAMLVEDLYISREEIRIHYEFRNATAQDIETIVAFPLPAIDLAVMSEVPIDYPSFESENFVNFSVSVDGRPVSDLAVDTRATVNGQDVTAELERLGLPLVNSDPGFYDVLNALPQRIKRDLTARGIVIYDEYGGYPQWVAETVFYWTQTFPAGRTVMVDHRYEPVAGLSFFSQYSLEEPWLAETFCIDEPTKNGLRNRLGEVQRETGDEYAMLMNHWVSYVLTTGGNWRGPIGRFTLTIDKGEPDAIVSLCIDDIRKTGPTTFVAEHTNYVPTEDLDILFVTKPEF